MNISEIAQMAGVSRTTVSRYLNDGYVSKERRKQIARVIEETGYVPSRGARQLRTGKTGLVGVIIPRFYSQSISETLESITAYVESKDIHPLIYNSKRDVESEIACLQLFDRERSVDGVIFIASFVTDELREILNSMRIPVVVLLQNIEGVPCVYHNDYQAAYDIALKTIKGRKIPAYIGNNDLDEFTGRQRHQGFLDACASLGIEARDDLQLVGDYSIERGKECALTIIEREPACDAIVCATDFIAYGALATLKEHDIVSPDDVKISGFGDNYLSEIIFPHLTSAHFHNHTAGEKAAEMLLKLINDEELEGREVMLECEIIERHTTSDISLRRK